MTTPVRLQLSRAKGFALGALSLATNGLPVVNVARPHKLGNPVVIGLSWEGEDVEDASMAAAIFEDGVTCGCEGFPTLAEIQAEARGKNVACWCALDKPCHGDFILRVANQ